MHYIAKAINCFSKGIPGPISGLDMVFAVALLFTAFLIDAFIVGYVCRFMMASDGIKQRNIIHQVKTCLFTVSSASPEDEVESCFICLPSRKRHLLQNI
jgi:hypothetical protein